MKRYVCLFLLLTFLPTLLSADNEVLLKRLDSLIRQTPLLEKNKQENISKIKNRIRFTRETDQLLNIYKQLYAEYYVYQFDSATVYVNKGLELAKKKKRENFLQDFRIMKFELLSIGGFYEEAERLTHELDTLKMTDDQLFVYHNLLANLYNYKLFDTQYKNYYDQNQEKLVNHLIQAKQHAHPNHRLYMGFLGDYVGTIKHDMETSSKYHLKVINEPAYDFRQRASSAYSLANIHRNNVDLYEKYLIYACIYDVSGLVKESAALHELAMYLYTQHPEQLERARTYIMYAYDIAQFYKNRLRLVQIGAALPTILTAYQQQLDERNRTLSTLLIGSCTLMFFLLLSATLYARNARQLRFNKRALTEANSHLSDSNIRLHETNRRLSELNQQLTDTNLKRENLALVYIELCSKYIGLLKKYQTTVKRKILAHQEQDLLSKLATTSLTNEDTQHFLENFDKAFIELYPSFVEEFNSLLHEEFRSRSKSELRLTTEQRIFALVRLGVKESSEIANFLSYSPQTIYNYRSEAKNKAIDKDNFEKEVRGLCRTSTPADARTDEQTAPQHTQESR